MKEKSRLQQEAPPGDKENNKDISPITSDSVKNAHAAGDGAMERSTNSIPDEEELNKDEHGRPQPREQY